MSEQRDVAGNRLPAHQYEENFTDIKPPLTAHQAVVESDRCYFCFDAPCTVACPTHIDIPSFIYKIRSGNLTGSARNILAENIFGASCARVCPVEDLCEGACVRNTAEDKPVAIGLLQRHATDALLTSGKPLFDRASASGKRVAVAGGGPAGLACAHRLAMLGHDVTVYEARLKLGGLNEHGIARYKLTNDIAQREIDWLLSIGGISVRLGQRVGVDVSLSDLRRNFDAVFLSVGLGDVNALGLADENIPGVYDAVRYIETLRQSADLSTLHVGRRVVVIGGGMTAIDIAVQVRKLGADEVTLLYRRGPEHMGASDYERELAQSHGVNVRFWSRPRRLLLSDGEASGVEVERTALVGGKLVASGEPQRLACDMLFKAIGQTLVPDALDAAARDILDTRAGKLAVDDNRRTSLAGVWAGGDCIALSKDLTVAAVQDGKLAAIDIDRVLRGAGDSSGVQHG
ncbi:MAG TPA: NAD(P)-dependent oxidoreductase [Rhodanobacteraceae bacterium]|nr:NAD(P)-dependent oxidoreductase [Rhodanobacteraceae bacterium]